MKIEKLNENQIRCTLTSEDLASRHLELKDLAYGTRQTQNLFQDMIRQADAQYGFETGDLPLMIEAIPMNRNCIVLIITKVEDPEELDTRFSRFAPSIQSESAESPDSEFEPEFATPPAPDFQEVLESAIAGDSKSSCLCFRFQAMTNVMDLASCCTFFPGQSSLYKDSKHQAYILSLTKGDTTAEDFRKICTLATEYGDLLSGNNTDDSYLSEHLEVLIQKDALKKLG